MLETDVVDSPEATDLISSDALPSVEAETPAIEGEESAASETTDVIPETPERSWSLEEWKEHPQFKEWYEDDRYDHDLSVRELQMQDVQENFKRLRGELAGRASAATNALNTFNSLAVKAIEEEGAQGFANALAKAGVFDAYKEAAEVSQGLKAQAQEIETGANTQRQIAENVGLSIAIMFDVAGQREKADEHINRFGREFALDKVNRGRIAFTKAVKAVLKDAEEKGYRLGLNAGKSVSTEMKKGTERAGQGPSNASGAVSTRIDAKKAEAAYANGEIGEAEARRLGVKF